MARFGVFRNSESAGYLLDVQADLLVHLNIRVVVPLLPLNVAPTPAKPARLSWPLVGICMLSVKDPFLALNMDEQRQLIGLLTPPT